MSTNLELRSTYFYTEGMGSSTTANPSLIPNRFSENTQISQEFRPTEKNKFAVATHMSQAIHLGLGNGLSRLTSSYSQQKLASKINSLLDTDNRLSLTKCEEELIGFDLNTERAFDENVSDKLKLCIKAGSHKGHAIVHIPAFVPKNAIKVPAEATNFKIEARLVAVSDFLRKSENYEMTAPKSDGKNGSYESSMLPILQISTQPMTAHLRLMDCGPVTNNASTALVIGVKFYHYENKKFEVLKDETLISVRKIF